MSTFENLEAFQAAVDMTVTIYEVTASFPVSERYGLQAQMRRAGVSVISNIAEGQGRLTNGEWRQALSHARGSLYEIEAQLIIARRLRFLADEDGVKLRKACRRTGKALAGLITYVRKLERQPATGNRQLRINEEDPTRSPPPPALPP
jgi:four helix bundle protein